MKSFENIDHDEFVRLVLECMEDSTNEELLQIPGVWEVLSEHFNNEALERWEKESPNDEPEEGDYSTEDHIHFYQYGKLVVTVPEGESIRQALQDHMNENAFFPNVWFISDHGNAHLMTLDD
jgi:hypothetical protein